LPDLAKHYLIDTVWYFTLQGGKGKLRIPTPVANKLVAAVQPIPLDSKETWHLVEQYLVERLHEGAAEFEDILGRLTEVNPEGLVAQLRQDTFAYLKRELGKAPIQELLAGWVLSLDEKKTGVAHVILERSDLQLRPASLTKTPGEKELRLPLLRFVRRPLLGEKTARYLLFLEPLFREASTELRDDFKREMTLQAINYPGACLATWKKVENPSDLLREVIAHAEKYFDNLRATKDSPATGFAFSGCKEAAEKEAREFSNKVAREGREKSVFAKFAKNVQVIYGSRWSMVVEGKLGEPTGFSELTHPEGMAIRRLDAAVRIRGLTHAN
jgi:hypothetical protein